MRVHFPAMALVASLLLAAPAPASAHAVGISRGEYRIEASVVHADLVFAREELTAAIPGLDRNDDGVLTSEEIASANSMLQHALVNGLQVRSGSEACAGQLGSLALAPNNGVVIRLRYHCAASSAPIKLQLPLLASLSLGHRHLATIATGAGKPITQVVHETSPEFELQPAAAARGNAAVAAPFFTLGIEHILTGFDHLAFLFGVVLIGGKLRSLLLAVTAFTLAHSVTLGLAVLGVWAPSPALVEPLIALSIVYVGIENWFVADASRRWLLTLPFGLIHGFGFAGALQEVALPSAQLPLALLSFNLGVEAGQIMVLALMLPGLFWLRRQTWFARHGVRSASGAIAVAGLTWFVQRIA
jgi:hydrogenase/urease accessory protein HupE